MIPVFYPWGIRVERDAGMGWWWVEVGDGFGGWESAHRVLSCREDTFARSDSANRMANQIAAGIGLLASKRLHEVDR